MEFIYKTTGNYFGFIKEGLLYSRDGEYLGWVEDGKFVWDAKGNFRGFVFTPEKREEKFIIRDRFSLSPTTRTPKPAVGPITPPLATPTTITPKIIPNNTPELKPRTVGKLLFSLCETPLMNI